MAEPVQIKNEQGTVRMTLLKYEDILWPPPVQEPVKTVTDQWNFPYKDGDLFVCSYPRTGWYLLLSYEFIYLNNEFICLYICWVHLSSFLFTFVIEAGCLCFVCRDILSADVDKIQRRINIDM